MRLYHGTDAANLDAIQRDGILPRGLGNKKSNWDHTVKSRKGHVYLTSVYPFYFAMSAVQGIEGGRACIIEVEIPDTKMDRLYPDEDFIAQAQAHGDHEAQRDLLEATRKVDLEKFQPLWRKSLEHLGNVSHRGHIPVSCITRVATVDLKERIDLVMGFGDPSISLVNFRVMAGFYQGFVSWLMGDRKMLPGLLGMDLEDLEKAGGPFKERADFIRKQSADRHGIAVRVVRP